MKKHYYLLLLSISFGFAQIPAGYYSTATGTGYPLKTQLYNIIKTHTNLTYSGLWTLYPFSDKRNDGKVWDIYSSCSMSFGTVASGGNQDNGTAGSVPCERFNREHTFPKSWFGGSTSADEGCDAFHVMPADKKINGLRSNYCYGTVSNTNNTIPASYATTCKLGVNNTSGAPAGLVVFEPSDDYKGDVARNYFYMATCYQNSIASWQNFDSANGSQFLDGTNSTCYKPWALNMLYAWHLADPVSQKEIDRNNVIYYNSSGQANRNPYIDHPEWVVAVWGANLATNNFNYQDLVSVYPNPTTDHRITIESAAPIENVQLITINGQIIMEIKNPSFENNLYSIDNLSKGFYFLKLASNKQAIIKKVIVN